MDTVTLIGLDFGTTTSSAVIASANLLANSVTGRMEMAQIDERYHSDLVFTPFQGEYLDQDKILEYLDGWLAAGEVRAEKVFGGGALLTGLAAQKDNARTLTDLIRRRLGNALIASADDPCLEAWLAFMGSCARLSREHPEKWFLNLDIGGGTTNLALGKNGEVFCTGCLFVGARHVEVEPGTYRIVSLSTYARKLFDHLGITKGPEGELTPAEMADVVGFYVRLLQAAVDGKLEVFDEATAHLHQQVAFRPEPLPGSEAIAVTLSGGVGELVYGAIQGRSLPSMTYFGDLGIDLAERLLQWPGRSMDFRRYIPTGGGRATAYGLLRHSTQVSGSTVYLSHRASLPLHDIPILGTITDTSSDLQVPALLELAKKSRAGGCVQIRLQDRSWAGVRALGTRIAACLQEQVFPPDHPLVILVPENIGKSLGQYISQWHALPLNLTVIDEIGARDAQYVHVGTPHNQVIPVSFYGLQA
jgi:ethanolamine utilization protein EutA